MTASELIGIHLSDLHLTADPRERPAGQPPLDRARAVLNFIRTRALTPDFCVISGDLSHDGQPDSYRQVARFLVEVRQTGVPVIAGLGNHDQRVAFRQVVLGEPGTSEDTPYVTRQVIAGLQIIMLDSRVPGAVAGSLSPGQLDWLDQVLDLPMPRGHLLVFHHPPFAPPVPHLPDHQLTNTDQLAAVIQGRALVGMLHGHIHIGSSGQFHGTVCATAPGVAYTYDPLNHAMLDMQPGAGFNLVHIREGTMLCTPISLPHTDLLSNS